MAFDEKSRPALARGVRLQTDIKTGEPVLLFPEGAIHLSETAEAILKLCNGVTTVASIIESLAKEYEASPEALSKDVLDCLWELHQGKLVIF
jgi:pyrroloquinoline quinone biosynthesis protein D